MTTAVPLQLLDSDARSALTAYRNLLINARFWINQRSYSGAATMVPKQYTRDRWRVVVQGQAASFADTAGAAVGWMATAPAGGLEQVVERTNFIAGQFVLNWQGTATATVNGATVQKGVPFSVGSGVDMVVRFSGGTVLTPQLERGRVATAFECIPYALDLAECRRYFTRAIANGQSAAIGNAIAAVTLPVTMRAQPTGSINAPGDRVDVTVPGGIVTTTDSVYVPFAATAANGYVIGMVLWLDAEITA